MVTVSSAISLSPSLESLACPPSETSESDGETLSERRGLSGPDPLMGLPPQRFLVMTATPSAPHLSVGLTILLCCCFSDLSLDGLLDLDHLSPPLEAALAEGFHSLQKGL